MADTTKQGNMTENAVRLKQPCSHHEHTLCIEWKSFRKYYRRHHIRLDLWHEHVMLVQHSIQPNVQRTFVHLTVYQQYPLFAASSPFLSKLKWLHVFHCKSKVNKSLCLWLAAINTFAIDSRHLLRCHNKNTFFSDHWWKSLIKPKTEIKMVEKKKRKTFSMPFNLLLICSICCTFQSDSFVFCHSLVCSIYKCDVANVKKCYSIFHSL